MYPCETCSRTFNSGRAVWNHQDAARHWSCATQSCHEEFSTRQESQNHGDDGCSYRYAPFECEMCYFDSYCAETVNDHRDDENHWRPQYPCEACRSVFNTPQAARKHMDATNHWRVYYCESCKKGFQNENNLKQHKNSATHRGTNLTCPFCQKGFTTATGVTLHLETGSCPRARDMNHDTILSEIRRRDPSHLITKKLLTYPDTTTGSTTATPASYNRESKKYECYLCHRGFVSLQALNQHVNSPAHRMNVYHCPGKRCGKEFRTLSGLFNHLESETCGAVRFEAVQRNIGGFLEGGRRRIAFA
ncbi:zinc finger protein [Massarina eburnea CBS 473.64]|uniref:Zinc finger protein n=1 Tax=Massarina eburnea CBS 473.64 TaxID=1395130 RepID=A0A6A6SBH0_9PLEO|nr:zinc finger protein [Massarina eburnea CBS 473.64]